MIMRSAGVCRQRRAPTSERAQPGTAAAQPRVGRPRRVPRHAAEGQQDDARETNVDSVQQQHVVGGREPDERAADRDAARCS